MKKKIKAMSAFVLSALCFVLCALCVLHTDDLSSIRQTKRAGIMNYACLARVQLRLLDVDEPLVVNLGGIDLFLDLCFTPLLSSFP